METVLRIQVAAEELSNEILPILKERHHYRWMRLIDQVLASVASVAHNISEGHGRTTTGEKLQMLSIANGSARETITGLRELESVDVLTSDESWGFIVRYKQLSVQILLFAAALLDRDQAYKGAYLKFAMRGVKLRAVIHNRRKEIKYTDDDKLSTDFSQ